MRRSKSPFLWSIVLVLATVVAVILMIGFLEKSGRLGNGHVSFHHAPFANCAAVAFIASPLFVHLAACAWWRHDRRLAVAGLLTVAISCGMTLWGNLTDYVAWSRLPPPTDQVTYLGWFFAMLGAWGVCAAYIIAGIAGRRAWSTSA